MIDAPLALALASGMVAAVNPCGFAMLPAYVTFFLGHEGDRVPSRGESVARAIPVALAVSLGFVVVFGVVGIALRPISSTVQEYAPWATIVIGVGLAILGVAMVAGKELKVRVPVLDRGGRSGGLGSMFLYGVSYAIASLTCTIGIFIANIVNAFSRTDFVSGVAVLVTYAAGMGLVITALTVAIALARDSVVRVLRSGMRHANRAAAVLMVVMGLYVAWYGVFSLRVRSDPGTGAGPVDRVEQWSADATRFVSDVGATRLGLYLLAAIAAMVSISVLVTSLRRQP
ncbi:cytochrome c biogenesis protein CcdA [Acidimicrobiia bacterium EGI L10123]|uniref:cytochrome c biogenesis CcdA family protein n=1 Tax=Salinilacustrithrix flava TaxID=2957203 RepID=UPI003D7C3549|nr:cytochrome c biogenesis protein CcdA [Acidimicrobiia bacterium EGI L10123]